VAETPKVGHVVWYGPQGYEDIVAVHAEIDGAWAVSVRDANTGAPRRAEIIWAGFGGWVETMDDEPTDGAA
jgi:hypothetical protein